MIAGVDGIPGGWLVALVQDGDTGHDGETLHDGDTLHGKPVDWVHCDSAAEVLRVTAGCAAVGVDVPLGLPASGYRACDLAARTFLDGARSSVFLTPPRAVLDADLTDYADVCRASRAASGKAVSKQLFHILDKIADWDAALPRTATGPAVLETHPEVSFRRMAPEVTFGPKRSAHGAGARLLALGRFVDIPAAFQRLGTSRAMLDDALDALACAFSAGRWVAGTAVALPQHGIETDDRGRPMRIVS